MSAEPQAPREAAYRATRGGEVEKAARILILDYGMGNLRSVEKAFARVGVEASIGSDPASATRAEALVLPGVGAFPRAMERIGELGLERVIGERLAVGTPVLGICLGFELLFEFSDELGGARGLGLLNGDVSSLEAPGLKLPHMGWESVRWSARSELTVGIEDGTPFYFVHGFAPRPADRGDVLGVAEHGRSFVCAIARPPLYGVQFHPEKSSAAGLRLLANFARIARRAAARGGEGGPSPGPSPRPADELGGIVR